MSDKINAVEDSQRAVVDRQVALESAVQSLQEENASLRDRISSLDKAKNVLHDFKYTTTIRNAFERWQTITLHNLRNGIPELWWEIQN